MFKFPNYNSLKYFALFIFTVSFVYPLFSLEKQINPPKKADELVQDNIQFLTKKQDQKINKKLSLIYKNYKTQIFFISSNDSLVFNSTTLKVENKKCIIIHLYENKNKVSISFSDNLDSIITKELNDRIITHEIYSNFDKGKYYRGIDASINIYNSIFSQQFTAKKYLDRNQERSKDSPNSIWLIIFLILTTSSFIIYRKYK